MLLDHGVIHFLGSLMNEFLPVDLDYALLDHCAEVVVHKYDAKGYAALGHDKREVMLVLDHHHPVEYTRQEG